jgi:hypothetical protein
MNFDPEGWLRAAFGFAVPFTVADDLTSIYGLSALTGIHEGNPLLARAIPLMGPFGAFTVMTALYLAVLGAWYYMGMRWARARAPMAWGAVAWILMLGALKVGAVFNNLFILAHALR